MSTNQPQNNSEEVDLGQLFNAIGNLFQRFFNFIGSIFKAIFGVIIFLLKAVITYFKIIAIALLVAFIVGFAIEKTSTPVYASKMIVEPYFGSKYQLIDNVEYYNALISNADVKGLVEIFEISEDDALSLVGFSIDAGPENETDKLRQYDEFLTSIDTSRADLISYKEYLENRDIYSSEIYEVTAKSRKNNAFKQLEKGINKTFANEFSMRQKRKNEERFAIEKASIEASLRSIDSIQKAYLRALEAESRTSSLSLGEGLRIESSEENSKELGLVEKEIELRNRLRVIEQGFVEENQIFEVVSGFKETGQLSKGLFRNYKLLFPLLTFVVLSLLFFGMMVVKFVKSYDSK